MKPFAALSLLLAIATSMGSSVSGGAMAQTGTINGSESTDSSSGGSTLTLHYWQAPSLLVPYLSDGDKDAEAASLSLEPLANYGPDGQLVPRLATVIPTRANGGISADGRTVTWNLKKGVRWSDGTTMTAEDVIFTWKYCTAHDSGCQQRHAFNNVAAVKAVDPHQVRIEFIQPQAYPYSVFTGAAMPILSQHQFGDCLGVVARACAEERLPLGTGPYSVTEFTVNQDVTYVRNPFFHGPQPYFDDVLLKGGGTALDGAQAVLEEGTADYGWNVQAEYQVLRELEAEGPGRLAVAFGSLVERIYINQTNPNQTLAEQRSEYNNGQNPHPFLTFPPIVQAMSMAIDRKMITDQLYGFAGRPECNVIAAPPDYVSTANDTCLIQNITGANALLDAHGVVDHDGDGIRDYRDVPLHITFQTSANAVREATYNLLQDWWQQIGISTDLVQHDASVFFGGDPVLQKGQTYVRFFADAQMFANSIAIDPEQSLFRGLCSAIPESENRWTGGNISRACNENYDARFEQLRKTPIGPERQHLVKQLNDLVIQQGYEIPLVNRGITSAVAKSLRGFKANPWDSQLWNVAQWFRVEPSDRDQGESLGIKQ
ncbi:peptide ABC transporter substrate-binding protein [Candidatus Synechococcus spongiarum]|uniref:Oligopeptide ABC transporter, periplasmic oligopeptide-binding protein OppA (TC 3.A.1.5.1) n=1 Tax=Candidatus Synechococcus spongiarum TaxID=431041 RepID=A0A170TEH7_9SYNE|nr:peptide ABC transporter substrate-binding protein [Candidatus Synechococcus spongiarum]CZB21764.1 Oligopeptide ABC transporter, periplasmic oligopeptide-binding protein OppA (TC 3.A.1.5.1) [Candidatus Synechococcus spongiarum]